uniref:Uncharacterized protein n=1 Tax=Sus scrofa TaxID=9823 RepID=A0A8D1FTW2_PIG
MVNGIASFISVSNLLFLVNRNVRYFCVLILYPAALLNSLMSSSSFLVVSLGFSIYRIMSANIDSFTSSFPIWIPFIYFSSLIAMARTSKITLNKSGENRHPCIVSDLRGKFFTIENNVSCGFPICGLYYVEVGSLYAYSLESFFF